MKKNNLNEKTPTFEARVYGMPKGDKYVSLQWTRDGKFFTEQVKFNSGRKERSIELKDGQAYLISITEKKGKMTVNVIEDYLFAVERCPVTTVYRGNRMTLPAM